MWYDRERAVTTLGGGRARNRPVLAYMSYQIAAFRTALKAGNQ